MKHNLLNDMYYVNNNRTSLHKDIEIYIQWLDIDGDEEIIPNMIKGINYVLQYESY